MKPPRETVVGMSPVHWKLLLVHVASAVTIHNHPRGTMDAPHDMHDGTISQWAHDGPFYRYAMAYTNCSMNSGWLRPLYLAINWFVSTFAPMAATCHGFNCAPIAFRRFGEDCGFLTASQGQTVKAYVSWDLVHWVPSNTSLLDPEHPLLKEAILFRPSVIYSHRTQKYVLWVNRIPKGYSVWDGYTRGGYIVAEADEPSGPFAILAKQPNLEFGGGGDFALLADGDKAWIAYGSWDNGYRTEGMHAFLPAELNAGHRIAVQPLTPDFTDVVPGIAANTVTAPDQEAPTLFQYSGIFYLLHGDVCCFCPQGSDAKVLVANDPMGNWTFVSNLNGYGNDHVSGQSNSVFKVNTKDGHEALIWTADLWQSSRSGFKSHDVQFWSLLEFDWRSDVLLQHKQSSVDVLRTNGVYVPRPLKWVNSFEIPLSVLSTGASAKDGECISEDNET